MLPLPVRPTRPAEMAVPLLTLQRIVLLESPESG